MDVDSAESSSSRQFILDRTFCPDVMAWIGSINANRGEGFPMVVWQEFGRC